MKELFDEAMTQDFAGGLKVFFRPIRPADAPLLEEFFYSHSERTIMQRYLGHVRHLSAGQIRKFVTVDYRNEFALVGLLRQGGRERIIGIARYCRSPVEDEAEVAVVVHDDHQGRGIGTFLVKKLMEVATANGIRVFTANILGDNHAMLHIFQKCTPKLDLHLEADVYEVRFPIRRSSTRKK